MARKALTPRQHEFMAAIRKGIAKGLPPTLRDMAAEFGVSTSTSHKHVNELIRKGHLEREGQSSRGLRIVGAKPRPKPTPHDGPTLTVVLRSRAGPDRTPEFHTVTEAR